MNATLFNGAGGIKTHQVGIDVTSNNLANVNTVGFKGNTAQFQSFLQNTQSHIDANSPISNGYNHGVTVGATPTNMKQGSFKDSDGQFHMAYSGKGWFTVGTNKNGNFDVLNPSLLNNTQKTYFTRDGQFMQDAEGYLVNSEGFYLYGIDLKKIGADGVFNSSQNYAADQQALSGSNLQPIQIPKNVYYRPSITTKMDLAFNLNRTESGTPFSKAFSDIDGTVNFDALFAQDMNAFMDASSKPIDVKAYKDFVVTKETEVKEQVPNPDFNPDLPVDPETNPETIEQITKKKTDIAFVYGSDVTDANGTVIKKGFKTLGDLKNLLAAEGLTLDAQRSDDGKSFEGEGLMISNAGTEPITITLSGSLAKTLGLTTQDTTLQPLTGDPIKDKGERIAGSALTVPTFGYSNPIYDEQGNEYSLRNQFYLKKGGGGDDNEEVWVVKTSITNADGKIYYSDSYVESELVFQSGKAVSPTNINVPFLNGSIALNLTGTSEKATTSFSGTASAFMKEEQNGVKAGILSGVSISENGYIHLSFTNGKQEPMGRVGLAAFVNDQGLKQVGGNLFEMDVRKASNGQIGIISGPPLLAWDTETGNLKYGSVLHRKVELANVDVASALTELIVFQRGYSFNAKAFTTGDELIKEAIGLKR